MSYTDYQRLQRGTGLQQYKPKQNQYALRITVQGQGTTQPAPGNYTIEEGSDIVVTALPGAGYKFGYWLYNGAQRQANPITFYMYSNVDLVAVFVPEQNQYALHITVQGQGTTQPAPGNYTIEEASDVTVSAIPNTAAGYKFGYWLYNGAQRQANPITFYMYSNVDLVAVFVPEEVETRQLLILAQGAGSTNPPEGLYEYPVGTEITVTAVAAMGWRFEKWLINGTQSTANPTSFTLNQNTAVTAFFVEKPVNGGDGAIPLNIILLGLGAIGVVGAAIYLSRK